MKSIKSYSADRIPSLDGLRAISILFVLWGHASARFMTVTEGAHRFRSASGMLSYFGVTVFFVISGYLITFLLLREHDRTATISLPKFYRRRAVRILPASLVYIGVVLLLGHPTFAQSTYALTFTTTYFFAAAYMPLQHLWSLSVEEQFYLLWPFVVSTGLRHARRYCWAIMAISPLVRIVLKHQGYAEYSHCAPAIADSLVAGCLLAFYRDEVRTFARKYLASTPAFVGLCGSAVFVAFILYRSQMVLLWGIVPILIALIVSAAIERKDWVLNNGPIVWIGLLSYSLYLWQQPFLVFGGPLHYLSVRLALTFVFAYLSYRFVEQPPLRWAASRSGAGHIGRNVAVEPAMILPSESNVSR